MTPPLPLPYLVAGTCLIGASLAYLLAPRPSATASTTAASSSTHAPHLPSALIPCYTTHARLLPTPSRHAFAYPLLYIGADIDALERRVLDVPYRIFAFGGVALRLLGLRAGAYLGTKTVGSKDGDEKLGKEEQEPSLRAKVEQLVRPYNVQCGRVWLVTMPSLLGWEGINPLSVWYIYAPDSDALAAVVLEVHNTFGEKHAYVLPTSSPFAHAPKDDTYTHAWTFPRGFHVSPFNSRDGFYTLDLVDPFARSGSGSGAGSEDTGTPHVRVFLRLLTPSKQVKLHALLASSETASPVPLGQNHASAVLRTVLRWPLALLLTTPRILWHAYRLHYEKRLAVYPRPEPADLAMGSAAERSEEERDGAWNQPHPEVGRSGRGIEWQPSSFGEIHARGLVRRYLESQGRAVRITFSYPAEPLVIAPGTRRQSDAGGESKHRYEHDDSHDDRDELCIHTTDPKFFINLLLFRPIHFIVLAPELGTTISSPSLFLSVFADIDIDSGGPSRDLSAPSSPSTPARLAQRIRSSYINHLFTHSLVPPEPAHLASHPGLAHTSHFAARLTGWMTLLVLVLAAGGERVEEWAMGVMGARFVEGREPWKVWERAAGRTYKSARRGSLRREREGDGGVDGDGDGAEAGQSKDGDDDWIDLGSVRLE